jgi:hypothetical protein
MQSNFCNSPFNVGFSKSKPFCCLAPSYRFDVVPKESAGLFIAAAWVSLTEQK